MSDIVDKSEWLIEASLQNSLRKVRQTERLFGNGRCLFCDEAGPHDRLFCDSDCRDDYERVQEALRRTGM